MESFFFFSPSVFFLEKSTQHGPDVLVGSAAKSPSAACTLFGGGGMGAKGDGEGVRLPAACIMPELFHATGSLNFRIHPRGFAFCGPFHSEQTHRGGAGDLFTQQLHCDDPHAAFYCNNDLWMNAQSPPPHPHPLLTPTKVEEKTHEAIFLTLIQDK